MTLDDIMQMDLQIRNLMRYTADKASVVINGVSFSNGIGDGEFGVFVCNKRPDGMTEKAWIDLRDAQEIKVWRYDCNPDDFRICTSKDFYNAKALGFGFDEDGNLYIWKMF